MNNRDFFPLILGMILKYRGVAPGEEEATSIFKVLEVRRKWPDTTSARCTNQWSSGKESGGSEFSILKRPDGIFKNRNLIFPLPLKIGRSWPEGSLQCTVQALDATTEVLAGKFNECLRITYLIAAGGAGWGHRFYAPGIGLVREDHSDEASPWSRVLIKHDIPYDVFIAHASEDKDAVVRPLAEQLQRRGLRVWYDEFTLTVGDSLNESINRGIGRSRYGVVVLSPSFFNKNWPQKELNGLTAKEVAGQNVILPVWHEVTKEDVLKHSPIIADKVAGQTREGIESLANDIAKAVFK